MTNRLFARGVLNPQAPHYMIPSHQLAPLKITRQPTTDHRPPPQAPNSHPHLIAVPQAKPLQLKPQT